jgi:hypothetical protein
MNTTVTPMTAQERHEKRFAEAHAHRRNVGDRRTNNSQPKRQANRFWALVKDLASAQL